MRTTPLLTRRRFLECAARAALAPATVRVGMRATRPASTPALRVGILASGTTARDRRFGALLGVEEARHAARLFGGSADLVEVDDPRRLPPGLSAIIGDEDEQHCQRLAEPEGHGVPLFMNVACASDALRDAHCSSIAFHVFPSDAMLRDAREQAGAADVLAWDAALVRFGADTLNGRFKDRFNVPMTSYSWAAWFAVKSLWESALRMKSAEPAALADYLTRDTTQFDGHKGRPLSFRRWDHQLRQFLYARVGGKLVDVPENAPSDATSREFLDRIGTPAARSACKMS